VDRDIHLIFVMNLKRNQNEKAKLIKINKIIGKFGSFTVADVEAESSPILKVKVN
jgi:hypothetical protein